MAIAAFRVLLLAVAIVQLCLLRFLGSTRRPSTWENWIKLRRVGQGKKKLKMQICKFANLQKREAWRHLKN